MGKGLTATSAVLIGCGTAMVIVLLVAGLAAVSCYRLAQDPEGVGVVIESPTDVVVGETFTLTIHITNLREEKAFRLTDLDLGAEYLQHFVVVSTDPAPESTQDNAPFDASRTFRHNIDFPPGETRSFEFTLRAEEEGLFRGDLDVCEGIQFLTKMLQTSVKPAEG